MRKQGKSKTWRGTYARPNAFDKCEQLDQPKWLRFLQADANDLWREDFLEPAPKASNAVAHTRILWPTSNVEKDVIGESLMPPLVAMTFNKLPVCTQPILAQSAMLGNISVSPVSPGPCRSVGCLQLRLFAMSTTSVPLTGHSRLC